MRFNETNAYFHRDHTMSSEHKAYIWIIVGLKLLRKGAKARNEFIKESKLSAC